MVPCLRAHSTASITVSAVLDASAAKMPPVWNQRTPSSPNSFSQLISPGLICEAAECPRSEHPSAARMPKPFSVKLRPTRVLRPMPSNSRQMTCDRSTPPCMIRSSTNQPRSLTGNAVTTVERLPQHLRIARATLYSPPPSHTWKLRALRTRPNPGSNRSITSPRDAQSQRLSPAALIVSTLSVMRFVANSPDELNRLAHLLFEPRVVLLVQYLPGDEAGAHARRRDTRAEPGSQRFFGRFDCSGRHDTGPGRWREHCFDEVWPADRCGRKDLDDLAAELFGKTDLGRAATTRAVGDLATIAELGDVRIEDRTHDEAAAIGDVDAPGRRVDNRSRAHDHTRIGLGEMACQFDKHVRGKLAAVGELDALGATVGAGLDHLFTDLDIRVVEDRYHPDVHHRCQDCHAVLEHAPSSS